MMRIGRIEAVQPPTPGSPPDWRTQLGQILVRVTTDDGLEGVGVGGGGLAGVHVVESVLRELLVGREFDRPEDLHREMCRQTAFYGRKGVVVMAISGVDLALWDLAGKVAHQPVAKLLKPNVDMDAKSATYVTVFDDEDTQAALKAGHAGMKLHVERFGLDVDAIVDQIRKIRDTVAPDTMVMMDAFARWDVRTTLAVAAAVQDMNVKWIEEPLPPNDRAGYKLLARDSPVPIAGGEHEYLAEGFQDIIDHGIHSILQPDVNWCGGLTTLVQIYEMAKQNGLTVCPHRGSEPYALHAIAAIDPNPLAESPRSWFNCLAGYPQAVNGLVQLNDNCGFGVSWA